MSDGPEQFLFIGLGIFLGMVITTILFVILLPSVSLYDKGACEARGGTYAIIDDEYTCITYKEVK